MPPITNNSEIAGILRDLVLAVAARRSTVRAFSYYQTALSSVPNGTFTTVLFDTKLYDTHAEFNKTTGKYTPLYPGYYHFDASVGLLSVGDTGTMHLVVRKNGVNQQWVRFKQSGSGEAQASLNVDLVLDGQTDYVDFAIYTSGGSTALTAGPQNTWLTGHLIGN